MGNVLLAGFFERGVANVALFKHRVCRHLRYMYVWIFGRRIGDRAVQMLGTYWSYGTRNHSCKKWGAEKKKCHLFVLSKIEKGIVCAWMNEYYKFQCACVETYLHTYMYIHVIPKYDDIIFILWFFIYFLIVFSKCFFFVGSAGYN